MVIVRRRASPSDDPINQLAPQVREAQPPAPDLAKEFRVAPKLELPLRKRKKRRLGEQY